MNELVRRSKVRGRTRAVLLPAAACLVLLAGSSPTGTGSATVAAGRHPIDLSLKKSADRTDVPVGEQVAFTLTLANQGASTAKATGIAVSDTPDAGLSFSHATVPPGTTLDHQTLIWSIPELPEGAEQTLVLVFDVVAPGVLHNCAEVKAANEEDHDSTPGNAEHKHEDDDDCASVTGLETEPPPGSKADLELIKTVSTSSPFIDEIVTFRIAISNRGPSQASGVIVRDVVPPGLVYVDAAPTKGYFDSLNGFWGVGTLAMGETEELVLRTRVVVRNMIENVAQVIASDQPDPDSTPGNGDPTEDDQDNAIVEARGPGSVGDVIRCDCTDLGTINALVWDPDRDILVAGSETGRIHVSTDGGVNWPFFLETDSDAPVRDLLVAPSGTHYAATLGEGAFISTDGGSSWAPIGPAGERFEALALGGSGVLLAAAFGRVLLHEGAAWSELGAASNPFGGRQVNGVAYDATSDVVYASTFLGAVYAFSSGTWTPASDGLPPGGVNTLRTGTAGSVLVGTNNDGVFVRSGGVWVRFGAGLESEPIESLGTGPDGALLAGSRESGAYAYDPADGLWLPIGNLPVYTVESITVDGSGRVFAGAPGEGIYMIFDSTGDGALDVAYKVAGFLTTAVFQDVVIDPSGDVYAATYGYGVLHSNDGGKCWTRLNRGLENLWVYAILRLKKHGPLFIGIWADSKGGIWRSDDDGRNWELVAFPDRQIVALSVDPSDDDVMYAGVNLSGSGSIYRTENGGTTWTVLETFSQPAWSIAVDPADSDHILVGTAGDGIWESTDGGSSFSKTGSTSTGLTSEAVFEVDFAPFDSPFAGRPFAGTSKGVYRRDASGSTWSLFSSGSEGYDVRTLAFVENVIFAGSWNDGVIVYDVSTDAWIDFGLGDIPVVAFAVHYEESSGSVPTLIIGTAGHGVYLAPNLFISTATESPDAQLDSPVAFELGPNYPNPFNPATTIPYEVAERGPVRISVYNLLGKEIALLVDEVVLPGRQHTSWYAAGLPSGVYVVRMEAPGGASSRAVTLLK